MSELIQKNNNRATVKWQLLASVSALALIANAVTQAKAEDSDRPTVWIELGGQMELMQSAGDPFTAPFLLVSPKPNVYAGSTLIDQQKASRLAFGLEGKVSFQPEDSDWIFSAGIRYGRSHARRHVHNQSAPPSIQITFYGYQYTAHKYGAAFSDIRSLSNTSHTVLDFSAGRDVGLGIMGRNGSSAISGGVRIAQFSSHMSSDIEARPGIVTNFPLPIPLPFTGFRQYEMHNAAERSFHGVGPSVSWNGSASLIGNPDHAQLMLDVGVNAAILFGRQKARTSHNTAAYYKPPVKYGGYPTLYPPRSNHSTRSRSVTVPNLGGFAAISMKYPNAKITLGYRADFFFGAVDTGIDQRRTKDLGFSGPFATVSIGLGG
ncbi:MAG TPA: hypothetical protein VG891_09940 [Rhizomicrobium sp.]|nr:hypothetical protein [Rhizomicrobium sp.]